MTEGSEPSGMQVSVTPPAKEPRAAEVLADSREVRNGEGRKEDRGASDST